VNDIDSASKFIAQVGLPVFLLLLCLYAVFKLAKIGAERLLGKEDGILTKLIERHMTFLKELSDAVKETGKTLSDVTTTLRQIEARQEALITQLKNIEERERRNES